MNKEQIREENTKAFSVIISYLKQFITMLSSACYDDMAIMVWYSSGHANYYTVCGNNKEDFIKEISRILDIIYNDDYNLINFIDIGVENRTVYINFYKNSIDY